MSKKLLFAIIATICATTTFADTKTVTTQSYVDNKFQEKIPAKSTKLNPSDQSFAPSVVTNGATAGNIGQMGIITLGYLQDTGGYDHYNYDAETLSRLDSMIPSFGVVDGFQSDVYLYIDNWLGGKQMQIPTSGYKSLGYTYDESGNMIWSNGQQITEGDGSHPEDWLNPIVKGTGLVTKTYEFGEIGERKIFEESDVPNYQASNLTANQKAIQKISIPTMGAVMAAISANAPSLPTGTAGNVVTYNAQGNIGGSVATYNGSTTYNASTDASKIAVMSAVQRKMTCARYVQNAAQTAENCLLWNVPD